MTEAEWLACADPEPMLVHLQWKRVNDRNRRLLVSASFALLFRPIAERTAAVLELNALFADGEAPWTDLAPAISQSEFDRDGKWTLQDASRLSWFLASRSLDSEDRPQLSSIVRDIFGNSFRLTPFDSNWRTATVVFLAQGIYIDRAFDRLPILADALEDAGCTDAEILNHCRQPGEHVRGCWVVDLVLGKS